MLDSFLIGTSLLFGDPVAIFIFVAGLLGGMIFGAVPGVSLLTLGAVILPFTANMTPTHAVTLYAVVYCAGVFGGAITAILFNIPGAPENAPTAFDGYPMAQQGKASKAIGAAVLCSAAGGLISAVVMMLATPTIANFAVRSFGPPEVFALIFFGISVAASIGASTVWKGWLSVGLGLMLATIGTDPTTGTPRFTFGSYYLTAGISFVPLILGFFAISEILSQGGKALAERQPQKPKLDFPSFREFWGLKFTFARSSVIGFFAGILPGIGAVLAAFLSYNETVRWSKNPERFGKGELAGVVASETANNSATGAAMIPLLALGLPGGALTAMMLGVFQIHGIEAGPLVFVTSHDLVWTVFAAMFYANLAIIVLGYIQTRTVVYLLHIPFHCLAPVILLLATVGAYALRNSMMDVWVMFIAGFAGFILRRYGYSMAGIVLGLILGSIGEAAFSKTMQMFHFDMFVFFQRPIAAFLITAGVLTLMVNIVRQVRAKPALLPAT